MKKLMMAAAVAALTTGVFASGNQAQVYDVKITVKTTVCKSGKVSKGYLTTVLGYEKGAAFPYRAQASRTILGLLWGCGCDEAFSDTWEQNEKGYWHGNVFWDKKSETWLGDSFDDTLATFDVIHRIGKKANEVEMCWTLVVKDLEGTSTDGQLTLAGFGKIDDKSKAELTEDGDVDTCNSVVKSAKGNVAGYLPAASGVATSCIYCDDDVECAPWAFCACEGDLYFNDQVSVASGTWSIKYNKSASSKLSKSGYITQSGVKMPSALKKELVDAKE